MIQASTVEVDALNEIANVGMSRAATRLSTLLIFHDNESCALVNAFIGSVPTLAGIDMHNHEHEVMMEQMWFMNESVVKEMNN